MTTHTHTPVINVCSRSKPVGAGTVTKTNGIAITIPSVFRKGERGVGKRRLEEPDLQATTEIFPTFLRG